MSTAVTVVPEAQLARPLDVLVPLIKEDVGMAETAGAEYYRAAGAKLQEARSQVERGRFRKWLHENFAFNVSTAYRWMDLAGKMEFLRARNPEAPPAKTQSEVVDKRHPGHRPNWHKPVQQVVDRVNVESLREQIHGRKEEKKLQRALGLQLIDIGYKVLASKLHPDHKGGSEEAMTRLNAVRKLLKGAL